MLSDIHIVIPVYEDWEAVSVLLERVGTSLPVPASVLLVNDGSAAAVPADLFRGPNRQFRRVEILHLRRNVGHQRAIAVGLMHLWTTSSGAAVVVMDGDGEDRPEHVPVLLERLADSGAAAVFAARTRRPEGLWFRLCYRLYVLMHRILVGRWVRMGNFSVLRWELLRGLAASSELWNHYAAAVLRMRPRISTVPLPRGSRIRGSSRMNFAGLVGHGLSAITVFGDTVAVRLLTGATAVSIAGGAAFAGTAAAALTGVWTPPPGALLALLAGGIVFSQTVLICFLLAFLLLNSRSQSTMIPERDCPCFIDRVEEVELSNV